MHALGSRLGISGVCGGGVGWGGQCSAVGKGSASVRAAAADEAEL